MRSLAAALILPLALAAPALAPIFAQPAPTCTTGLCLQQIACANGGTTSISGTVYAPNGNDPLPNVLVYIPNAAVDPFVPGVSCPVVGQAPSGSPIVGATTAVDGTFTITNVPVGANIPLVIVSGRWRRQVVIPTTNSCANTVVDGSLTRFPRNQSEGDIPKFAIATGAVDQVECVLRKVGIADSEFTTPSGSGRINLYTGSAGPGVTLGSGTPTEAALMGSSSTLNSYDVLMLPCEGTPGPAAKTAAEYANLTAFANAGGRVYASHYSYQWMDQVSTFSTVANWFGTSKSTAANGTLATVDTTFSDGTTLAQWLSLVGAATSTNPTTIPLNQIKHDLAGINTATTQSYLALNSPLDGDANPIMQFVWDAPVGAKTNQCGRVLFNEYHVESGSPTAGFPAECPSTTTVSAQEKLLEYSLFELTNDGGAATLTPTSNDFGSVAVGFSSAPFTFTWTNNSTFPGGVTSLTSSGDFTATPIGCTNVPAGGSCTINVVFTPTSIGSRTGTLTVGSSGSTLLASLTGTGIPPLSFSVTSLNFGNLDVGATSQPQTVVVTNNASGSVAVPGFVTTGDFKVALTTCGSSLAANSSCAVNVTFNPSTTGPRTGTLAPNSTSAAYSSTMASLTGNGVDFTFVLTPTSGTVIAGDPTTASTLTSPIAGFAAGVTLTCTTPSLGTTCTLGSTSFIPAAPVTTSVKITTTSQYVIIGYTGGFGGTGYLWLVALATGSLLFFTRKRTPALLRAGLTVLLLAAATLTATGCSGKQPAQNSVFTAPGSYPFTITATDGFLVHTQTYTLNVTAK